MKEGKEKKKVVILGSTGSIGRSALQVLENFKDRFEVFGLSAHSNSELIKNQIKGFKPKVVVLTQEKTYENVKKEFSGKKVKVDFGIDNLKQMISLSEVDIVINAIVGSAGLLPSFYTLQAGKTLALANKESLVMAGEILTSLAKKNKVEIFPVDSEHSAIKQCLLAGKKKEVKRLILTASGGPFYQSRRKDFSRITVNQALAHPTWEMGKKITVDSATLMNKGLELIEAHWLFDIPASQIKIMVHPQSVIHSMVEFVDGSIVAQMSKPDMKIPIQYALLCPERMETNERFLDLTKIKNLTFLEPDLRRFPGLKLCYFALESGGTAPCVLNAANEVAVEAFLNKKLAFDKITLLVRKILSSHKVKENPNLKDILEADTWAKDESKRIIQRMNK
jgi:1-deoxy-D-xylulose-5-phosphate reductoisomerase